jgi:hypothetical protein
LTLETQYATTFRPGCGSERLEQSFVRFYLKLQLLVFLRPNARLPAHRQHIVNIDLGTVGAQDRLAQPSFLKANDARPFVGRIGLGLGLFRGLCGADDAINLEAENAVGLQHRFQQFPALFPDTAMHFLLRDVDFLELLDKCLDRIEELPAAL